MDDHTPWRTADEAASYLRIAPKTLRVWRYRGLGPRYSRLAGPYSPVRYHIGDLEAWLRERQHESTSAESAAAART